MNRSLTLLTKTCYAMFCEHLWEAWPFLNRNEGGVVGGGGRRDGEGLGRENGGKSGVRM